LSATRWLRIKAHAGRLLLACLVVSVVASVFWYRRQRADDQPQAPAAIVGNDSGAEMVTRDFRHVETRMDRTIWVLEAARAEIFEDRAKLHAVKVTWYGEPGAITVVITSAEGTVDFRDRQAELRGDVRVERADGAVLRTETITWDEKTKMLRAPAAVVITTPNFTFRGAGLDANLGTEHVTLRGRVQGEIRSSSLAGSTGS
jgi:LPS export ABC transporter protein LptC